MSFESNKTLTGVGAILVAIGAFVPFLGLVGIILVLIGMRALADYYKDNSIFQDALYGFIFGIIGIVAAAFLGLSLFFSGFAVTDIFAFVGTIVVALVIAFVFLILEAIYYRRAFEKLADKTGEKMFNTAGMLLLIGAILTIVIVGFILILVAWILAAAAFFAIRTQPSQQVPPPPPPAPPQQ